MNDTTLQTASSINTSDAKELGEAPSLKVVRMIDQFFYGIGIVAFIILALCLYFND